MKKSARLKLTIVENPSELNRVGRFRYKRYVEGLGRIPPSTDHVNRSLLEEIDFDKSTTVFFVESDGECIGTVRVSEKDPNPDCALAPDCPEFALRYPEGSRCYISRLMTSHACSMRRIAHLLLDAVAEHCFASGYEIGFVSCAPRAYRYFRRFGFVQHADEYISEVAGKQIPMLISSDPDYLEAVNSRYYSRSIQLGVPRKNGEWLINWLSRSERLKPGKLLRRLVNSEDHWPTPDLAVVIPSD